MNKYSWGILLTVNGGPTFFFFCWGARREEECRRDWQRHSKWGMIEPNTVVKYGIESLCWTLLNIRNFLFGFIRRSHVVLNGMNLLKSSQILVRRIVLSSCQLNLFRCSLSTTPTPAQGDFLSPFKNMFCS